MQILVRKLLHRISTKQTIGLHAYSTNKFIDVGQPTPASHPQLMKEGEITPGKGAEEYNSRRKGLLELLPENSVAILAAAPVKMMTDVVPYTYRQDADYLYITGCEQPGGLAVLSHECGLCMFTPETSPHVLPFLYDTVFFYALLNLFHKISALMASNWATGPVAGVAAALETFKAEKAYPMRKIHEILPDIIGRSSKLFHNKEAAAQTLTDLKAFQKAEYYGKVKNLSKLTDVLRWVKSPAELKLMRESASIACQDLLHTMMYSKTRPYAGMLATKFEYECKMRGAQRMAFNPVVGGGSNATVIHYSRNDQKMGILF
ncbi:hypothetical protein LWI29_013796 [Acer saccharum]|uniref:Aminopeptidase P N-terminal domain-containing protein n=1 Tax=Acer saccharum TaxID=4024 RepID=A0AA39VVC1_ACESA|nr:hypothetical protein LWI29_013796 [Acer saccharum]